MPSDEDRDNVQSGNDEGSRGQAPTVHFDTTGLDERIAEGVMRGLSRVAESSKPKPVDPELQELTIDEDDDELTRQRKMIHNELIPVKQRMSQFQEFGLNKLADLTDVAMTAELPYRARFRSEIDAELSRLPAAARSDKATLRLIHDTVAMRHLSELQAEAAEAKARELLQEDPHTKPGNNTSRNVDSNGNAIPSPEEMGFDDEQLDMIESRGGPDRFAQSISNGRYKNWADYAAARQRMQSVRHTGKGRVIPFKRMSDLRKGREQA